MESHQKEEEEMLLVPEHKKGGLRTVPFIIVNESFERLASSGLSPNMVFYLMDNYHMEVVVISTMLSLWGCLSGGLSIFGAAIADSYAGRFRAVAIGSLISFMGITGIWLTTIFPQLRVKACGKLESVCDLPNAAQLAFLYFSFLLMSVGAAFIRPCSMAFGIDQLKNKDNPENERLIQTFINWYNVSIATASVIAITVVVYIQDHFGWKVGFGLPVLLMLFSAVGFLLGSSFYTHVKPSKSCLTGLFQVPIAAFKNRNISLPPVQRDDLYYQTPHEKVLVPTDSLRFLNKACLLRNPERNLNLDTDASTSNPCNLCTVEQVESLKDVIRIMPMWSSGIMLLLSLYQNSFSILQAKSMNRHIIGSLEMPAASIGVILICTVILWLSLYDRILVPLIARYTKNVRGLNPEIRIGISLLLSVMAMVVSALVEERRRKLVVDKGLEDDPYALIDMSVMWLAPQYILMGIAEGMGGASQIEFFYTYLPKNISSVAMALYAIQDSVTSLLGAVLVNVVNDLSSGGGKTSWLASNINKGHIDYFYWLIAFIGFLNFLYFLICLRGFQKINNGRIEVHDDEDEGGSPFS